MMTFYTLIVEPVKEMLLEAFGFIPVLVSVLFVLLLGPIVAKVLSQMIQRLLKELKIDRISGEIGMSDLFHKGGVKRPLSEGIGRLVYWLFVVIFILITVKMIGLSVVSESINKLFDYIPHVLSAVVVLTLGIVIAKLISGLVHFVGVYTDLPKPKTLERITRWAIVISVATIALDELGFGSILIGTNFQIIFGAVCFAFALAYGLGGKDAAAKHLEKYTKKYV